MGTKNTPGQFDCYSAAHPDEPMFVLLGRDPDAAVLVRIWAALREARDENPAVVGEARACSQAMRQYAENLGKPLTMGSDVLRTMNTAALAFELRRRGVTVVLSTW